MITKKIPVTMENNSSFVDVKAIRFERLCFFLIFKNGIESKYKFEHIR